MLADEGTALASPAVTWDCDYDTNETAKKCKVKKRILFGPEVYHVNRKREGGTRQSGWLSGGRILIDNRRRYCIYCAFEGAYARGSLHGHTGSDVSIKSHLTNATVEGRLGYTFYIKPAWRTLITPFIGIGYLWEGNNFFKPSDFKLHFLTKYSYFTGGLITSFEPTECLTIGLNIKLRYMWDPRCHISNDPEFSSTSLRIGNDQLQYRFELPITYDVTDCWSVVAVPFYERRYYGKQADYPFDYMRTIMIDAGTTLMAEYKF
jgi:hypothetical protein